jgi:hypothetical protein
VNQHRKLAVQIAASSVMMAAVLVPAAGAYAASSLGAAAAITLTPNSNVANGGTITIRGTNFKPSVAVYAVECSHVSQAGCDEDNPAIGATSADGTFTLKLNNVHTGKVGNKRCKAGGSCFITATTDTNGTDKSQTAQATFTFAPAVATKTTAKAKGNKVVGKIKAASKGIKGAKAKLELKKGGKWKKVSVLTTKHGGVFASKTLKHSGKYKVVTPAQTVGTHAYKGSHSRVVTV